MRAWQQSIFEKTYSEIFKILAFSGSFDFSGNWKDPRGNIWHYDKTVIEPSVCRRYRVFKKEHTNPMCILSINGGADLNCSHLFTLFCFESSWRFIFLMILFWHDWFLVKLYLRLILHNCSVLDLEFNEDESVSHILYRKNFSKTLSRIEDPLIFRTINSSFQSKFEGSVSSHTIEDKMFSLV